MAAFETNTTVLRKTEVTDTLCLMRLRADSGALVFKPGQFTMVGLPPEAPRCKTSETEEVKRKPSDVLIRRAYSMSSDPEDRDSFEIYVSLVKKGELSPRLFHLKDGDRLWSSGKAAGFFTTERIPETKGLVMFSTGTGVAPFISIIRSSARQGSPRPLILVHAVDVSAQLAFDVELKSLRQKLPGLHYFPVVTFPDREPSWKGLTGWIQDDLRKGEYERRSGMKIVPAAMHAMLCGNPAMIKAGIEALEERGFKYGKAKDPDATLSTEEYW
jgi:ferredoxin--NADP+ reductase